MYSFSIIIPTINRKKELEKLLESISILNYKRLNEVIIVDQNKNNLIDDIVNKYKEKFVIKHYKVDFIGASKARNFGALKATGEILNFPDDDSQMIENTLETINKKFIEKQECIAICGKIEDRESKENILRFFNKDSYVSFLNLYNTTIECNLFIKKDEFIKIGMFDENLGIGTYYGAEEGADLICRLLYKKKKIFYINETLFYHPNKKKEPNMKKYYSYGLGTGRLAKKHIREYKRIIPLIYLILKDIKSIGLIVKNFIINEKLLVDKNINLIKGRNKGFLDKYETRKEKQ